MQMYPYTCIIYVSICHMHSTYFIQTWNIWSARSVCYINPKVKNLWRYIAHCTALPWEVVISSWYNKVGGTQESNPSLCYIRPCPLPFILSHIMLVSLRFKAYCAINAVPKCTACLLWFGYIPLVVLRVHLVLTICWYCIGLENVVFQCSLIMGHIYIYIYIYKWR